MKKLRKTILGILAISALLALLVWAFAPRPVMVELATATSGRFEVSIDEDGKTRVHDRYTISAPLSGRLERLTLREGDTVAADTVVATLTPALSPMLDTRSLAELSTRIETADARVSYTKTRIDRSRIALQQARDELGRSEKLLREKFVSASKVQIDRLALQAAEKELASAIEEQHVATHELAQARAALTAVRQGANADSESGFKLKAPVGGSVLRVLQASETTIALGAPILEIGDTRNMEIVAELLTTDALQVKPGTEVRIENWGGKDALKGSVHMVEPAAFTKVSALGVEEQRVRVLIDITSKPEQWQSLGDAYRVGVRIITLSKDNVLQVPVSAVFPRANSKESDAMNCFVFNNGRARLVPVEVGARNGTEAWITSGLKAGDQVIIYPGDTVSDGARVTARKNASMN
jgi:HlyD family secretion protein